LMSLILQQSSACLPKYNSMFEDSDFMNDFSNSE
jgi:hypothetical protein